MIVGPIAAAIVVVGNSSVIVGLFPAHFFWTFVCLARYSLQDTSLISLRLCFALSLLISIL